MPRACGSSAALVEAESGARAVLTPSLLTFARAVNLAAREASGDLLMILNDDTRVEPGAIERLATALRERETAEIVGPRLVNTDGSAQLSVYADPSWRMAVELFLAPIVHSRFLRSFSRYPYAREFDRVPAGCWLSGAALMISAAVYEEVGGLDETFLHGLEDTTLCQAVHARGAEIRLVAEAVVVHEGGASGFRNPDQVHGTALSLARGAGGWIHYWRAVRGRSRLETLALRLAFGAYALSRVGWHSGRALLGTPAGRPEARHRARVFVLYLRHLGWRERGTAGR
jgi:GT2 family glycosyltransferase